MTGAECAWEGRTGKNCGLNTAESGGDGGADIGCGQGEARSRVRVWEDGPGLFLGNASVKISCEEAGALPGGRNEMRLRRVGGYGMEGSGGRRASIV